MYLLLESEAHKVKMSNSLNLKDQRYRTNVISRTVTDNLFLNTALIKVLKSKCRDLSHLSSKNIYCIDNIFPCSSFESKIIK